MSDATSVPVAGDLAETPSARILGMGPKQWLPALMLGGGVLVAGALAYLLPDAVPQARLDWFGDRLDLALYLGVGTVGGGGLASDVIKAIRERRAGP